MPSRGGLGGRPPGEYCGARSRTRKISSMAMPVPTWSGTRSRMKVGVPSWGASMIPEPSSARTTPSRPVARPLATRPASRTSTV